MYAKGPITQIVKDCPSHPNFKSINLVNKRVTNLRQALINVLQIYNKANSTGYKQNSKLQILVNDNKIIDLEGIELVNEQLASFKAHNNIISNLKGIQYLNFPFLEKLYLQYNEITNLSGIETCQFPRLIRLTINNNKLTSQSAHILTNLNAPQLRVLGLDANKISSIEFVAGIRLSYIIDINLANNEIEDITPLGRCIFLSKLSKIELQNNRIKRIPNIGGLMNNLRKFSLSNNLIETGQGLISCQFPLLEVMELQNNLLTNISFLHRLQAPKLIDIKLSKNKVVRVDSKTFRYSYFPVLEQVLLKNNELTGNIIQQIMVSFADVRQARSEFYASNNSQLEIASPSKKIKLHKIITAQGNTLLQSQNTQAKFNNNKNFSMFSCWRNKLIYKNGPGIYAKMKKHFNKLSFLEF